jgi:3-hydroxyisobutyrate dehydrogenase-like beta-hydroxyacid dehydrogenase
VTAYGYIGLGNMGSAMVERLASTGAVVTVFDLDANAVAAAVATGARAAGSAAEVVAAAEIISICVPAAEHITAVLRDISGTVRAGQVILIHSTVAPSSMLEAAATAAAWGVVVHDACVAGGTGAARSGELVILAGGLSTMPEPAMALLSIYGNKVIDGGPVGSGAALKLAFNVMTYAQFAASAAAFNIVEAAGGETQSLVDAWRHVGQIGRLTENFVPTLKIPKSHVRGKLRDTLLQSGVLAVKDLDLAADAMGDAGASLHFVTGVKDALAELFGVVGPTEMPSGEHA